MDAELLPGFERRDIYMARAHGKSDFTGRRWQAAGKIVVRYFGRTPMVDIAATLARMRGDDRPRRGHKRRDAA